MCVAWDKQQGLIVPGMASIVGRTANCWHTSHYCIGWEFTGVLHLPAGQQYVLGIVIHGYLQAEFPGMYQQAFNAWKGNFGYSAVVDNGSNAAALYPANRQWVIWFRDVQFAIQRACGDPPNGCVCCIGHRDPCRAGWPA